LGVRERIKNKRQKQQKQFEIWNLKFEIHTVNSIFPNAAGT
jgi:hypothetical protein